MIDLTQFLLAVIAGVFTIAAAVIPTIINKRMKDTQAASVLSAAITNALGAMQQAASTAVAAAKPGISLPAAPPQMAVGVQYVLDHAGEEAKRFGITQEAIVDKINAKIGLVKIADPAVATALPTVNSK